VNPRVGAQNKTSPAVRHEEASASTEGVLAAT